ncbi:MAG TPA: undecaprenyldiphospho-muramoylpentapeptide beta-N-acetylglucosaminyltransferase [Candidatus Binataceae bacterium]
MRVIVAGGGTGGHLFPAIAVGDEIMRQRPEAEVLFVGTSAGMEAKWFLSRSYKYELFDVHGVRGHGLAERAIAIREFALALWLSGSLLRRFRPNLVIAAGGYASTPVGAAAIVSRIPLVLLEQNARPGLSNRLLWRFAKKICVAFPEFAAGFSPAKVVVTGNPIRFRIEPGRSHSPADPIQILVLGGSSGAHRLNLGVVNAFRKWENTVIKLRVTHQTGEADRDAVQTAYDEYGVGAGVSPFIENVAQAMSCADLIVARSGGNTVSEVALAGKPAIFVPYPFHRDQQQLHNARVLERAGAARIVLDDAQLGDNLLGAIETLVSDRRQLTEMGLAARTVARPEAAERVAQVCLAMAEGGGGK